MKLPPTAEQYFERSFLKDWNPVQKQFREDKNKFDYVIEIDGIRVEGMYRYKLECKLTLKYVEDLVNIWVNSLIEAYKRIQQCPDEEAYKHYAERCVMITEINFRPIENHYTSLFSPLSGFPSNVIERTLKSFERDLLIVAQAALDKLRHYMADFALEQEFPTTKEKGVYIAEMYGAYQSDAEGSKQHVTINIEPKKTEQP